MNKFVLIRQPMNLADAIGSCVAALESEKKRASVTVDVSEVWIDGDETRIQQIISNLLTNAIKFTPSHGTIRVSLKQAEGQAVLQVSDTGMGIPREIMPHIFDLFVQGERADGTASGMGIGLALVRRLVELHGGNVKVHSEGRGKGSTFTVSLPAIDPGHQASSSLTA